ncbi:Protein piccolo [Liparis tanakae]|uniref:Protein piccolo n=1 Tax=Liparis tanakae TaxID=230148 RepID=A0A4Z2J8W3_9TELE|nr:Protein piccolo [Liparis tanakae]
MITSAGQDDLKTTPPTPRKMSTTANGSPRTTPLASPKLLPAKVSKHPAVKETEEKKLEKTQQGKTHSTVQANVDKALPELQGAPKAVSTSCPLCHVNLNMGSKDPPNYNTCTACKTTVCNQCGFNTMAVVAEVKEWLCLNCQMQRAVGASDPTGTPVVKPQIPSCKVPGSELKDVLQEKSIESRAVKKDLIQATPQKKDTAKTEAPVLTAAQQMETTQRDSVEKTGVLVGSEQRKGQIQDVAGQLKPDEKSPQVKEWLCLNCQMQRAVGASESTGTSVVKPQIPSCKVPGSELKDVLQEKSTESTAVKKEVTQATPQKKDTTKTEAPIPTAVQRTETTKRDYVEKMRVLEGTEKGKGQIQDVAGQQQFDGKSPQVKEWLCLNCQMQRAVEASDPTGTPVMKPQIPSCTVPGSELKDVLQEKSTESTVVIKEVTQATPQKKDPSKAEDTMPIAVQQMETTQRNSVEKMQVLEGTKQGNGQIQDVAGQQQPDGKSPQVKEWLCLNCQMQRAVEASEPTGTSVVKPQILSCKVPGSELKDILDKKSTESTVVKKEVTQATAQTKDTTKAEAPVPIAVQQMETTQRDSVEKTHILVGTEQGKGQIQDVAGQQQPDGKSPQVKEWLCLNCQMQRAVEASEPTGTPVMKPQIPSCKVPDSELKDVLQEKSTESTAVRKEVTQATPQKKDTAKTEAPVLIAVQQMETTQRDSGEKMRVLEGTEQGKGQIQDTAGQQQPDGKSPQVQLSQTLKPDVKTFSKVEAKVDKALPEPPKAQTDIRCAPKAVSTICPLCQVNLNMGSKDPPNYNTCTACKTTVCNQCGFNTMAIVAEVKEWLCLNCQMQRAVGASDPTGTPVAKPQIPSCKVPGAELTDVLQEKSTESTAVRKEVTQATPQKKDTAKTEAPVQIAVQQTETTQRDSVEKMQVLEGTEQGKGQIQDVAGQQKEWLCLNCQTQRALSGQLGDSEQIPQLTPVSAKPGTLATKKAVTTLPTQKPKMETSSIKMEIMATEPSAEIKIQPTRIPTTATISPVKAEKLPLAASTAEFMTPTVATVQQTSGAPTVEVPNTGVPKTVTEQIREESVKVELSEPQYSKVEESKPDLPKVKAQAGAR